MYGKGTEFGLYREFERNQRVRIVMAAKETTRVIAEEICNYEIELPDIKEEERSNMNSYDNYLQQQINEHCRDCQPEQDREGNVINCTECNQRDCEYWNTFNEHILAQEKKEHIQEIAAILAEGTQKCPMRALTWSEATKYHWAKDCKDITNCNSIKNCWINYLEMKVREIEKK